MVMQGQKPNMRFFLSYGFVNQNNPDEQVPIFIEEPLDLIYDGFKEGSSGYSLKKRYLEEKGTSNQIRVCRNMDSQVIKAFMGWIILDVVYLSSGNIKS